VVVDYPVTALTVRVGVFVHGVQNFEFFPTIAEYDEAARRYPEPILSGEEDMMRLDNSIFFDEVYEAATLSREDLAGA
jgi:hypothetical protein